MKRSETRGLGLRYAHSITKCCKDKIDEMENGQ